MLKATSQYIVGISWPLAAALGVSRLHSGVDRRLLKEIGWDPAQARMKILYSGAPF